MGWNVDGTFSRSYDWSAEAAAGNYISSTKFDTENDTFATGIQECINKDGKNTPSTNLPMGGYKHTGVADGSARAHYASVGQVQDNGPTYLGTTGGAANVQTASLTPAITAYTAGQMFAFIAGFTNTSATTINVNSLGAKNIYSGGAACVGGEIISGQMYVILYDGTQFHLVSPVGQAAAFRAVMSVAQTLPDNTVTTVVFGTETYDYGGNFAANTFTAPVAGIYHLSAGGQFSSNATGARMLELLVGAATRIAQSAVDASATASATTSLVVSTDYELAASDTVTVRAYQNSGGTLGLGTGVTFFSGHLIRTT